MNSNAHAVANDSIPAASAGVVELDESFCGQVSGGGWLQNMIKLVVERARELAKQVAKGKPKK
jgi:hypothetical protein